MPEEPRVHTLSWRVTLADPPPLQGLGLVFAATRTRFERIELRLGERVHPQELKSNVLVLRFESGQLSHGMEVELTIAYVGEIPLIARAIWIGDKGASSPGSLLPSGLLIPKEIAPELAHLWARELAMRSVPTQVLTPEDFQTLQAAVTQSDVFAERRKAVAIDARVRAFFLELDERTHPAKVPQAVGQDINAVSGMLYQRVQIRAAFGARGTVGVPPRAAPRTPVFAPLQDATALQTVSQIFTQLHAAHLVLNGADLMAWAFEQFSIDCCAVFHHDPLQHALLSSHGAPDGSEYFKFCELAFACRDNNVDVAFWEPHLLALVRAAHSFAEHTDAPGPGAGLMGASVFAFEQGRWHSIQRRGELREDYDQRLASKTAAQRLEILEDCFTSILATVLCDTVVGATTEGSRQCAHPVVVQRLVPPGP